MVGSLDPVGVEILAENQLAAEDSAWPLGRQHFAVRVDGRALSAHSHHVALDVEVQRVPVDAWQVEFDEERIAFTPRVHRHHRRSGGGAQHLLGETVQIAEWVGTHQHGGHL